MQLKTDSLLCEYYITHDAYIYNSKYLFLNLLFVAYKLIKMFSISVESSNISCVKFSLETY